MRSNLRHSSLKRGRNTRRGTATVRALATASLGVLALAGCGSGADSRDVGATQTPFSASSDVTTATSNPSVNTSPAPGAVVSSDKRFNFVVPSGWNLGTQKNAVVYLSSATVSHDVAPTIVVSRSSITPAPALDDTLRLATMQARQNGQTVGASPDRSVGGEDAVAFTTTEKLKNVAIKHTFVIVAHDKLLYTISLTGAQADADRDESVLTSLLASWSWTKAGTPGSTASGTTPAALPTTTATQSSSSGASSSGGSSSGSSSPSVSGSSAGATSSAAASSKASAPAASSTTHPTATKPSASTR